MFCFFYFLGTLTLFNGIVGTSIAGVIVGTALVTLLTVCASAFAIYVQDYMDKH